MKAEQQVLDVLAGWTPPEAPERLSGWVAEQASQEHDATTPARMAFEDHAGEVFGYLVALVSEAWLAEELLQSAFVRSAEELPDRVALFQSARHAALELLAKSPATDAAPPADRALLLERRVGLSLEELARGWGTSAASLEGRLVEAARGIAPSGAACAAWQEPTLRAALDLLDKAGAEGWTEHLSVCSACQDWSHEVEAVLGLAHARPADPEVTWERIDAALKRQSGEALGIRVGVRCTYCHDRLQQQDAAFCAACLAPHHADCFRAHARCSAPGCPGDDLVFPAGEAAASGLVLAAEEPASAPARRPWLLVGALLVYLGAAALTTADWGDSSGTTSLSKLERGEQPAEAAEPSPIPSGLRPGTPRADVERLLGEPDAVRQNPLRLCYYGKGARVVLDRRERLVQASFFGVADSDEPRGRDRPLPQFSSKGYYRPGRWRVGGFVLGQALPSEALSRRVGKVRVDASGTHWVQLDERTLLEVGGAAPHVVRAVHLSPGVTYTGVKEPRRFDLSQAITAQDAFKKTIQAARKSGELKRLLGARMWIARGLSRALGRTEIQPLPGGAGLSLTFERWWYSHEEHRVVGWSRISEQVDWSGAPLLVTSITVDPHTQQVRSETHRPVSAGEYVEEVYEGAKRTWGLTSPRAISSHLFPYLLLPVLGQHLGDEEWKLEQESLIGAGGTLEFDPGRRTSDGKHEQPWSSVRVTVEDARKTLAAFQWPVMIEWFTSIDAAALPKLALRPPTNAAIRWPPGAAPLDEAKSERLSRGWIAELQAVGSSAPARRAKARTALVAAIEGGAPTERLAALRALARHKPEKGSADLFRVGIVKNLTALGPSRVAALAAHHTILGPNLEALNAAWRARDRELDLAFTRLIAIHTGRKVIGPWEVMTDRLLRSEDSDIRSATLRGLQLAEIGPRVASTLVYLAKKPELRLEVLRLGVAMLGKKPASCVTLLLEAISHPDRSVSRDMIRGLSFGVPTSDRPRAAEALIELANTRANPSLRFNVEETIKTYKNQAWLDRLTWGKKR